METHPKKPPFRNADIRFHPAFWKRMKVAAAVYDTKVSEIVRRGAGMAMAYIAEHNALPPARPEHVVGGKSRRTADDPLGGTSPPDDP